MVRLKSVLSRKDNKIIKRLCNFILQKLIATPVTGSITEALFRRQKVATTVSFGLLTLHINITIHLQTTQMMA